MKAPRIVLFGLGILVLALVTWLQHDRLPEATPSASVNLTSGGEVERAIRATVESGRTAADPLDKVTPEGTAADTPPESSPLARALALPAGFERQQLMER